MKKIAFLLMFLYGCVYGQDGFTVSGKVTDCKYKVVISSVTVRLVGSDGSNIVTKTNSEGYYFFDSTKVNKNTKYVVTTQVETDVKTTYAPTGYLNSSDKAKFNTFDTVKNKSIAINFCLVKVIVEHAPPPVMYFPKNNSIDYFFEDSIEGIPFISQLLKDNPNLVIEIGGHASKDEQKPKELALKRAELMKNLLVKEGIESDRLVIKSYSDANPDEVLSDNGETLLTAPNKKNRRVTLTALSRDYISENLKKEQPKNNTEKHEGE